MSARFPLGRIVATTSALAALDAYGASPGRLLARHQRGDWGDLDAYDRRENELSVRHGYRILSSYEINPRGASLKVWIITEADRSSTCLLLPEEY
ncbi:MAG: hypothetical protein WKF53_12915 [Rubrobacter sp.]